MAETPIVATSVGGVPDILSPRLGRLVPPMDPDALATSIQDVMIDPESAHHRAERAYSMLRGEFSLESWLSAYEDVYLEVSTRTMD